MKLLLFNGKLIMLKCNTDLFLFLRRDSYMLLQKKQQLATIIPIKTITDLYLNDQTNCNF